MKTDQQMKRERERKKVTFFERGKNKSASKELSYLIINNNEKYRHHCKNINIY